MSSKIKISGRDLSKTQIGANEYRITVFNNDKLEFQFNVSLRPTEKEDVLPIYQLSDESQTIPSWTKESIIVISDWITKEAK